MSGRRPLAIFSGDSVFSLDWRDRPVRAPIKARQMLALGFSVLSLQRKGMGGSGGVFMEPRDESIPQATQLKSALEDLDAAVKFVKTQDYVDQTRIVVMGVNRGGLLAVAYAGLHNGSVIGAVNTFGNWLVNRTWWQKLLTWDDFTATQFAGAGKKTKAPIFWIYGGNDPVPLEYARENFNGFTREGGRGLFVDVMSDSKSEPSAEPAEREERAILDLIRSLQ